MKIGIEKFCMKIQNDFEKGIHVTQFRMQNTVVDQRRFLVSPRFRYTPNITNNNIKLPKYLTKRQNFLKVPFGTLHCPIAVFRAAYQESPWEESGMSRLMFGF